MTDTWEKVLTTPLPYRAELAKALLLENGINAVVVNKQSSAYPTFGNAEVHVPTAWADRAKQLLADETTFG
jgi:hypothetical protein